MESVPFQQLVVLVVGTGSAAIGRLLPMPANGPFSPFMDTDNSIHVA